MKLYFYKDKEGNYGDDLNGWLWERLLPKAFDNGEDILFCGIGTILNRDIPATPEQKIIFGSGVGYGQLPEGFGSKSWRIISVRGPLSASILGLPAEMGVTDGAILLASVPEFRPLLKHERKGGIVFMPHHENALKYGQWQAVCRKAGITFLDPRDDSVQTTQLIRHATLVIAEAMHAAIVADAMRVPWIPVSVSRNVNHFKWLDWTLSLDLPYRPLQLPPSTFWEMWQNVKMKLTTEGHSLPSLLAEEALAHQRKKLNQPVILEWTPQKTRAEIISRRLGRIIKLPFFVPLVKAIDGHFVRKAAAVLKSAVKNNQAFLSDEVVYLAKVEEMKKRLDTVRVLAK